MTVVLIVLVATVVLFIWKPGLVARHWRKRQREVDMRVLWPSFVHHAETLREAKLGFATHMLMDSAWRADFTEEELAVFLAELKPESRSAP